MSDDDEGDRKVGPLTPCLAGCGYSVPTDTIGEPHKILVGDVWVDCPGR